MIRTKNTPGLHGQLPIPTILGGYLVPGVPIWVVEDIKTTSGSGVCFVEFLLHDPENGPVPNVEVQLAWEKHSETTRTDKHGRARINIDRMQEPSNRNSGCSAKVAELSSDSVHGIQPLPGVKISYKLFYTLLRG